MPVAGDAVDQVEADLVVLSAEAVHTKKVDCNLLAEFCTAPGMSCTLSHALLHRPSCGIHHMCVSSVSCIPDDRDHQLFDISVSRDIPASCPLPQSQTDRLATLSCSLKPIC